jgi:hypothetical protein
MHFVKSGDVHWAHLTKERHELCDLVHMEMDIWIPYR